jgi:hypothetical protein
LSDETRPDPRMRPPDPAGTQPRHDPESLRPASAESLLPSFDADATEIVDATTVEVSVDEGADGLLLPARRFGGGALGSPLLAKAPPPHQSRFQFILGGLIAIGVAALVAVAAIIAQPPATRLAGPSWSPWHPVQGGKDGASQIAAHVGPQYKLPNKKQLVAVTGGPLEVAGLPLTVALRRSASEGGAIQLIDGNGVLYRLCGLGAKCSISYGKPSRERHLLLRREALELALYSFRYLAGVDDVAVFMPPAPGKDPSQALFFRRKDVAPQLDRPLRNTLPPPAPSVDNVLRSPDAGFVNRLTTATLFRFSLTQANQDNRAFLVLDPFSPGS